MLVKKYAALISLGLLTACASTPKASIPTAEIKSDLRYDEAYKRITKGSNKCYPRTIVDHDLYTYKPFAEISINTHPWSYMLTPVASDSVGSYTMLHVTINGSPDNKSAINLNDARYEYVIRKWLNQDFSCQVK